MAGTTKELTSAMVEEYIERGGAKCPFCGSGDIEAGHVEADSDRVTGPVECLACGEEWRDVFYLRALDILDENGRYRKSIEPGERTLVFANGAQYRRGDWVRIRATGMLRRISYDYGPTFYPSLADAHGAMYGYEEVEPVHAGTGRFLSSLAILIDAVETGDAETGDQVLQANRVDIGPVYLAACAVLSRRPRTNERRTGDR